MLLEGKNAVIYGGGGAIGGPVARTFASEGARVHLAGRTLEMVAAGASLKALQGVLGHGSAAFSLTVYGHLFDDDLDELEGRLVERRSDSRGLLAAWPRPARTRSSAD